MDLWCLNLVIMAQHVRKIHYPLAFLGIMRKNGSKEPALDFHILFHFHFHFPYFAKGNGLVVPKSSDYGTTCKENPLPPGLPRYNAEKW
jgi:hypothetical protein